MERWKPAALLGLMLFMPYPSFAQFVPGDVNDDGVFDVLDTVVIRRAVVGLGPGISQQCVLHCGDDELDPEEACDGTNLNGETCLTQSFTGGELVCDAKCRLDTTGCTPNFVGAVTNAADPNIPGAGVDSLWSFGAETGVQAGIDMCNAIGSDHPCTYAEVLEAEAAGQLTALPNGFNFWLHRINLNALIDGSILSPPGTGGRCNDWTLLSNAAADGEFAEIVNNAVVYHFDQDTIYSGNPGDGHQGSGPNDGGPCGSVQRAILCCGL